MYEFKIGDEVEVVADTGLKGVRFTVGSVTPNFVCEPNGRGWFPSSLKLVCPAGYRPVREDEMDESPRKGDSWWSKHHNDLMTLRDDMYRTYRKDIEISGDTWFRPLTTESVKAEPVMEETPVVKEDNNWGWMCKGATAHRGRGLSESSAKSAAQEYSRKENRDMVVFKVMGEYSTTYTTKWTPTDE